MLPLLVGILQDALEFIETSVTGWNCVQDLHFEFKVTGKWGPYEFMLSEPTGCPNCKQSITERTLVAPKEN